MGGQKYNGDPGRRKLDRRLDDIPSNKEIKRGQKKGLRVVPRLYRKGRQAPPADRFNRSE